MFLEHVFPLALGIDRSVLLLKARYVYMESGGTQYTSITNLTKEGHLFPLHVEVKYEHEQH